MSHRPFGDLACGSNGGRPRQAIDEWSEFRKCRPEPSGLYEVNARFDDQQEYIGRAIDDPLYAQGRLGTGWPAIGDPFGAVRQGRRAARHSHDQRPARVDHGAAHGPHAAPRHHQPLTSPDGWTCTDLPPAAGETPVGGGVFIKQRCEKRMAERDLFVEARLPAQARPKRHQSGHGEATTGQFESWTRFELMDPKYKKP